MRKFNCQELPPWLIMRTPPDSCWQVLRFAIEVGIMG
jgi:hypothetical protein